MSYVRALKEVSFPVAAPHDLGPLVNELARSRIVMLGESTHGTHEFYELRRLITEWLVVKHGFNVIAVEGDWPDCAALDRYANGKGPPSAREVVGEFHRWPTWMWANTEILRLAEWLRSHNERASDSLNRVRFHGLDVYSLFESMQAAVGQLEKLNPFLARRVRARYQCFDPFLGNEKAYARSLLSHPEGCESEVIEALQDLLKLRLGRVSSALDPASEALFDARQNARVVRNAEKYYRALVSADEDSWNVRDRHMLDTLDQVLANYSIPGHQARAVVWAHNTHIGDYRATDMAKQGLVNLGGLAREKYGAEDVALVGFGTYEGTVIASPAWGGPVESLRIPPAKSGTIDAAAHEVCEGLRSGTVACFFDGSHPHALEEVRGQRAIGVVYDPRQERWGNYVPTSLCRRYDAFVFADKTRALEPLIGGADLREIPETWPVGQ